MTFYLLFKRGEKNKFLNYALYLKLVYYTKEILIVFSELTDYFWSSWAWFPKVFGA